MIFEGEEYDGCSFAGRLRAVYSRGCDRFRAAEQPRPDRQLKAADGSGAVLGRSLRMVLCLMRLRYP